MNELKQMSPDKLRKLWHRYFQNDTRPQLRPLWYKIQCERTRQKIIQKYITRLKRYATAPELCAGQMRSTKYHVKPGTQLIKKYRGQEYIIDAIANDMFRYKGATYKSLSAIAMIITGHKVSGYDFFGFYKKRNKE